MRLVEVWNAEVVMLILVLENQISVSTLQCNDECLGDCSSIVPLGEPPLDERMRIEEEVRCYRINI